MHLTAELQRTQSKIKRGNRWFNNSYTFQNLTLNNERLAYTETIKFIDDMDDTINHPDQTNSYRPFYPITVNAQSFQIYIENFPEHKVLKP